MSISKDERYTHIINSVTLSDQKRFAQLVTRKTLLSLGQKRISWIIEYCASHGSYQQNHTLATMGLSFAHFLPTDKHPIFISLQAENIHAIRAYLNTGFEVSLVGHHGLTVAEYMVRKIDCNCYRPKAGEREESPFVSLLFSSPALLSSTNSHGETPFHSSNLGWNNTCDAVAAYVDQIPDPRGTNRHGETFLHGAIMVGDDDLVTRLLEGYSWEGVIKTSTDIISRAIHFRPEQKATEMFHQQDRDSMGRSPLHQILLEKMIPPQEIARALSGAENGGPDANGVTPLHMLAGNLITRVPVHWWSFPAIANTDLHTKDRFGNTPLHYACYRYFSKNDLSKKPELIHELISRGADPACENHFGLTPALIKTFIDMGQEQMIIDSLRQYTTEDDTRWNNWLAGFEVPMWSDDIPF
jgi:ankyrin repeat protein